MRIVGLLTFMAAVNAYGATDHLRKDKTATQIGDEDILSKLLKRIEALENKVNDQANECRLRMDALQDTIETLETTMSTGRRLADECEITYNSATGMCHTNNTFAFDQSVQFKDGLTVTSDGVAQVDGKLFVTGEAEVQGMLDVNGPAMLHRGLSVSGGFINFDSHVRMGNITYEGTTFLGNTIFWDPVEFKSTTKFESSSTFYDYVLFTGNEEACFEKQATFKDEVYFEDDVLFSGDDVEFDADVTFKKDVEFKDPVEFHDDVSVLGPRSSSDSKETGFVIKGYVNVDFENKLPMDVYSETRFRDDVNLVQGPSSTSDSSSSSRSGSKKSSYSSFSFDTPPSLHSDGDITTESNLNALKDLRVEGNSMLLGGTVDVQADLAVTGTTTLNGDSTVQSGNFNVASGTTTLEGHTSISGGTTINGGAIIESGNIVVDNGNVDINGEVVDGTLENGDLTAQGTITAGV